MIWERANAQQRILERIEIGVLKSSGHLMRMEQKRVPHKLFRWTPLGKTKRRRQRSWNKGMR